MLHVRPICCLLLFLSFPHTLPAFYKSCGTFSVYDVIRPESCLIYGVGVCVRIVGQMTFKCYYGWMYTLPSKKATWTINQCRTRCFRGIRCAVARDGDWYCLKFAAHYLAYLKTNSITTEPHMTRSILYSWIVTLLDLVLICPNCIFVGALSIRHRMGRHPYPNDMNSCVGFQAVY